jgi:hypothetical protein
MEEFKKAKYGSPRDFVVITDESIQKECLEFRQMVWIVDVTHDTRPFGVSTYTIPEASGNFCSRGGRMGTHSSNESFTPIYYKRVMFFAAFNAGVRAVDVLETPAGQAGKVAATELSSKRAIQTNNVDVDDRGYIYIVDRANTGMHILELTGSARNVANWPKK